MARTPLSHPSSIDEPQGLEPLAVNTLFGLRLAQVCEPPDAKPGQTLPDEALILGFHGGGSGAGRFAIRSGMAEAMLALGYGTVYPQANGHWSDGRSQLEAGWPDDEDFIRQLRANAGKDVPVAVVGTSNGGMFAMRLACELEPPPVAAVAVTAGLPADYLTEAPAGAPVPIMLVQAPHDPIIPWGGGWMPKPDDDMPGGKLLSAEDTVAFFRRRNRVDMSKPPREKLAYIGTMPVEIKVWQGAADVWQVILYDALHGWPARPPGVTLPGSLEDMVARFIAVQLRKIPAKRP